MLVVPALPPGFLMKGRDSTGLAKFELTTLDDFTKALRLTKSRPQWDESAIYKSDSVGRLVALFPTVEEVERFCLEAEGKPLALDTETTGEQVLDCRLICCGFASANGAVLCVPFLKKGGTAYWAPHDEQRVREALKKLLSSQTTPKVIHNKSFDELVLWANGLPVSGPTWCSMQAHHCIDAELPHSLGYCGTRYLDIRYWKDDVKGDVAWLDLNDEILRLYNLRDCLVCLRLLPIFSAELTKLKLWDLFDEEQRLASLMARATIRGLSVDFVRRDGGQELNKKTGQYELIKGLGPTLHEQMNLAFAQLQYIAGRSNFDPLKPTDVRALLYDRLTLPVVKLTPSGLPGTDKEAMTLLALAADNDWQRAAIKALADFRAAQKMLSTFVEGLPVLGDGALHVSWKLLAVTGRFTSSPNAQNWNAKLKKIFCARQGFKFVGSDLSQAELRAMAYFADEPTLLEMYRRKINVHTVNAGLLFRVRPEVGHKDLDAVTEAYLRNEAVPNFLGGSASFDKFSTLKSGNWKSTRTLAKNFEFGCLDAETPIALLNGKKPIREIQPGDWTWCWDGQKYTPTKIVRAWSKGVQDCIEITMRDQGRGLRKIVVTPDHKMLMRDGSYKPAGALKSGDRLMPFRRYTMKTGYREMDPTNTGERCYEHRWVVQGAPTVHHLDHDRGNNTPENLRGLTHKEHKAEHPNAPMSPAHLAAVVEKNRAIWAENRTELIAKLTAARNASPKFRAWIEKDPLAQYRHLGLKARQEKAKHRPPCACGAPFYSKGLCRPCYMRNYFKRPNHDVVSVDRVSRREVWDLEVEHEAHNFAIDGAVFVSNSAYGAEDDTKFSVIRSKRDSDTNELLFPNLRRSEIEATTIVWKKLRKGVVAYWDRIQQEVKARGYAVCPISGRIRWFRGGLNRNEILNWNIQASIASIMNKRMLEIQDVFDQETGGQALVVQQVHDAVNCEAPNGYEQRAAEVLNTILAQPVALPRYPNAMFPPDPALIGSHLDQI